MPHTRSAKKRMRQSESRRLHRKAVVKDIKSQIKKVQAAAAGDDLDALQKEIQLAVKKLDKAGQKRVLHRNLTARKKSQLARLVAARQAALKK